MRFLTIVLIALLGLTACASRLPTSGIDVPIAAARSADGHSPVKDHRPTVTPTPMTDIPPAVVETLKSFISQESELPASQIALQQAEQVNWSDSCLGLAQPNEMCSMAITPGFRAIFSTPQGEYIVHSDENGRSHRIAHSP